MTMQYYIFIAFFVGGMFIEHFTVEKIFFRCKPCPEIVAVSTTTTHGAPIPVPSLVATGDASGVEAGEITGPKFAPRARRPLAAPAVAVKVGSIPVQQLEPKKYYPHPATPPVGFLRGVSAVLNTKITVKWDIQGTGIPTKIPPDLKTRFEIFRPDSIPEKTVNLQNTIITKHVGYGWIIGGTVVGFIGGLLVERLVINRNGAW